MGCWGSLVKRWASNQRAPRWAPCGSREKTPGFRDALVRLWGTQVGTDMGEYWGDLFEVDRDCLVIAWQRHSVRMVSTWGYLSEASHNLQHPGAYAPTSIHHVPSYYLMLHTCEIHTLEPPRHPSCKAGLRLDLELPRMHSHCRAALSPYSTFLYTPMYMLSLSCEHLPAQR